MVEKYRITGDIFHHIKSERTGDEIFKKAADEIVDVLKRYDFNVEEACAVLSNINDNIKEISVSSAYSQDLKSLF